MVKPYFYCIFLFIFFLTQSVYAERKIVYMTVAKGGSHMIQKALGLITDKSFRELPSPKDFQRKASSYLNLNDPSIIHHHLEAGYDLIRNDTSGNLCKIVMIRDPRDVIVSMMEWVKMIGDTPLAIEFMKLPQEQQIAELIQSPNLNMNNMFAAVFNTKASLQEALKWINDPSVFLCRFEDLIGPLGGGNRTTQLTTIRTLALHIGEQLSEQRIEEIADSLFGDTFTFRQGQIGSWHQVFTPYLKDVFKQTMGQELILLGYESNEQW